MISALAVQTAGAHGIQLMNTFHPLMSMVTSFVMILVKGTNKNAGG